MVTHSKPALDSILTGALKLMQLPSEVLAALHDENLQRASELCEAEFLDSWSAAKDVLALRITDLSHDPDYLPWSLRAIVRQSDNRVVGHIGCHAKPGAEYSPFLQPAGIEFGYTTFSAYRRQGIAREAALGLMTWALSHGASHFILSIAPDNAASMGLAAGFGFRKVGSHIDETDGPEDILELRGWPEFRRS